MKSLTIILILAALLIVGIASFVVLSKSPETTTQSNEETQTPTSATAAAEVRTIEVDATSFTYSPSQITLKKGQPVKLVITNTDKTHGITVPEFNARGIDSIEFTPDKTGTFEFRCPTQCGTGHRTMIGTIVVTE